MKNESLKEHKFYESTLSEFNRQLELEALKLSFEIKDDSADFRTRVLDSDLSDDALNSFKEDIIKLQTKRRLIDSTIKVLRCDHEILSTGFSSNDSEEYKCSKCGLWAKKKFDGDAIEFIW